LTLQIDPVWITGAGGLIGSALVGAARHDVPGWKVIGLTRDRFDLTDFAEVRKAFRQDAPQVVIHCAGLTKTLACENNPALAQQLNVEVTAFLADLCAHIPFLFFSSDLVFDGRKGHYLESDPVNPLNVYAETKAVAEQIVLKNPRHTVIRTSLNGGVSPTRDRGFNEGMRQAWQQGKTLRLFADEFRCPMAAEVTAQAIWSLVSQNKPGLYHLSGGERLSRWQIGQLLAARWPDLNPRIEAASWRDWMGAPRSPDTSLDCAKIRALLPFPLPGLTEWLASHPTEPF
jgi:dTDP-4-dehydrorhamnose reductase